MLKSKGAARVLCLSSLWNALESGTKPRVLDFKIKAKYGKIG